MKKKNKKNFFAIKYISKKKNAKNIYKKKKNLKLIYI